MRSLFNSLLSYFLTPAGVLVMGALDASVVFFLPLGIDFVVVIMTARSPELFWLYALLAAAGSVVGAALTYWMGRKAGEHGLSRLVRPSTLRRVQQRVTHSAAVPIAALGVIPPPFPFTAFILASGAWKLNAWTFLSTVAVVRLVRFGVEGALAARYGKGILTWMESTTFTVVIIALAVLAVGGTIVSAVAIYRGTRRKEQGSRKKEQGTGFGEPV
jgi:membrane protein YqaA with SNARE-associated domain